ncbi:MAG: FtsX-like permease family protein [Ethanoligenens sp.]
MQSVWMLTAANLRKHKSAGITLGLLTLIAALLLNLGLLSMTNLPRMFDQKRAALHTPDLVAILPDAIGTARQTELETFITHYKGVTDTSKETALFFYVASFPIIGSTFSASVAMENTNEAAHLSFVGARKAETDRSIYVPYMLSMKGYRLGDTFPLTILGKTYRFEIAGFEEDLLWGNTMTGGIRCFLPNRAYQQFVSQLSAPSSVQTVLFNAHTKTLSDTSDLSDALLLKIRGGSQNNALGRMDINNTKLATSMPVMIGAALEIAFAFVVALIVLLVVRFRIANSIEEDMRNIGALEAVGYTSGQIRGAFLLQFLLTALASGIVGIGLSYVIAIPHGQSLAAETGLNWRQGFDASVSLLSLAILLLCVTLVALVTSARIRKLPVITALRGGISTHSFRRNHFPLHKSHGPLSLSLACKSMLSSIRQNIALGIIFAAVSFATIFTFLLFYNFGVNNTAVMHLMGGESSDITVTLDGTANINALLQDIRALPHVTQTFPYGLSMVETDGKASYGTVIPDFNLLKNNQTYAGRYPRHDNEVAIGGMLASRLHKGVGDSVRITCNGQTANYLITGLTQSVNDLGKGTYFTDAGFRRIAPHYVPSYLYVYTENHTHITDTMHTIGTRFSTQATGVSNDCATRTSAFGSYGKVVAVFATLMFMVMGLIVILILALLTGAMLVHRRQEFGIQKALGFTTAQLKRQVALSFLPVGIVGALVGGLLGQFLANPLVSTLFRQMGLLKVAFILPGATVPVICVVIALLTFVISTLAAGRVRHISPCALMDE